MNLTLEIKAQQDDTVQVGPVMLPPSLGEDYWRYRVMVSKEQAVVGFPKFDTIGVGFAVEDYDENKNLPYTLDAEAIAAHIWSNKGPSLRRKQHYTRIVNAIRLIQAQALVDVLVPQRTALRNEIDRLRSHA